MVTAIALYHYVRISQSWDAAYDIDLVAGTISASATAAYNEAYRYVDWLLTVPLLLIELILVMNLSRAETISKGTRLALLAALMIVLGYPGEVATGDGQRWLWGILSMIPFLIIVYELFVGLSRAIDEQPVEARGLIKFARNLTVAAWFFYPVVYFLPLVVPLEGGYVESDSRDGLFSGRHRSQGLVRRVDLSDRRAEVRAQGLPGVSSMSAPAPVDSRPGLFTPVNSRNGSMKTRRALAPAAFSATATLASDLPAVKQFRAGPLA